jgi:hypothetical protein
MALQKTSNTPSPAHSLPIGPTVTKPPVGKNPAQPNSRPFWTGLGVSVSWVALVIGVIAKSGPSHSIAGAPLVDWAVGVSAAMSPVALVWMVTAYLQRAADIQKIAEPLRRQLTLITGESGAADARIRRFNQAIREQIELLRSAQTISGDDLEAIMERVRQHRSDLERFESVSTQQVKEIQDVIRRSMFQVEQMMDDKFTMLRVLDGKLQQNGDGVARQVEGVRDQVARLLEEVEHTSGQMADALERAQRDSKKLSDTSRLQESSLTGAAEAAADTLGGLSSKIDLSVTKFLERASSAREEAERLASALDAQTRALDEFSNTLPTRVSEAESVLRGVADRLYASEQMAREQAVHLSDKLSQQVDGLQGFMDRFTARMSEVDTGLDKRHSSLNALAEKIGSTTSDFVSSWERSLNELDDRTGNSLLRFTVVNDETRRNADAVVSHLAETTSKYEDVVIRMRALSTDSSTQMKGMTEEVVRHLSQFESLSHASNKAGEEVQERAATALQSLQHVLERVLTAREATQAVGETLVKDIYNAVDQNEKMINRLSETAQLGARAMGAATEALGRQESELVGKARAGEAVLLESVQKIQVQAESASEGLRAQTATLMHILAEAQSQLVSTDQKLHSFATQAVVPVQKAVQQIDASADQGLRTLSHYGEGLNQQVTRLQDFHARIGGMGEEMGRATAETANAFEQISVRFSEARTQQEEAVRQNLAQFVDLSDRLQREVAGLDGQAARAVEVLQQAACKVGEQSYQMLENAQSSGSQLKDVTAALQSEAVQIQGILSKQMIEVGSDLARAEQKFSTLGETIRERADAAYALLDRVAAHYSEVSENALTQAEQRLSGVGEVIRDRADAASVSIDRAATHYGEIAQNVFTQAETRFMAMNESIRDRAEAATVMLDRTTAHYQVVSATTTQDMEERAQKLEQIVTYAQDKIEYLHTALAQQTMQLDADATRIETHATEIAATSGRAVQNLSALNDKLSVTHEAAVTHAQNTLTTLDDATTAFERRSHEVTQAAESATSAVTKAGFAFGEQTGKLVDSGQQIDGVLRQLASATGALADQAAQIRVGMEQQNNRLLSQLVDSVAQMDVTGGRLQQIVSVATQGADQASIRFADMAETASQRLGASTQDLQNMAERTESTLAALGANITQQAASLSVCGEQIDEQQKVLASANENQRVQLVDLFEKLGSAHKQASDVAERSIKYLTDSLQEIHRQMGLIGDQSQAAVGTVKMASMGFSEQAASLLQNAQAAEQQARNVLTVTSALQEQARTLRETLQAESDRAGESLQSMLSRLTAGGAEIRDLGADAGNIFTTLQRALNEQTGDLGSSMQQISERQRTLTASLDQQREVINGLLNRLILAQDETASTAERTAARLQDGASQIVRHVETLDSRAQSALASVQAAAAGFAQESEGLQAQASQAEQQSRAIYASASGLHGQIHDLRTTMQSEGERTSAVLGTLLEKVTTGAAEMRDLSAATEMSLTSLGNNVMQQSTALTSSMQQIGDRQRSLTVALDAQRDVVNGLLNRLTLAQDETASIGERTASRLGESADTITQHVDRLDSRAQQAFITVQAAAEAFAKEAAAIDAQAQQAERQAQSILATASGLHTQIHDMRDAMKKDGESATAVLGILINKVAEGSGEIREASTIAGTSLAHLQRDLGTQAGELAGAMQQIGDRQRTLTAELDQQRDTINILLNRLTLAQDETAAVTGLTVDRLNEGAHQIKQHIVELAEKAQSTLLSVQAAGVGFAHEAEAFGTQARQAETQSRAILVAASGMHEQIHDLRNAMQTEGEKTHAVLDGLLDKVTSGAAEMRDMTAMTEISLTNLGSTVMQQSAALTSSMQQIGERQRSLASALDAQCDVVNGLLGRLTLAQDQTATVADRTAARLSEGASQITQHVEALDTRAQSALANVQAATEAFAKEAASINTQAQQAEQQARSIQASANSLHEQIRDMRTVMQNDSERSNEILGTLMGRVTSGSGEIREAGATAEATLASMQRALGEQANHMGNAMQGIAERQRVLTSALEQQREAINGMLNRMALAQDETASVAERTAARLSEGAVQITTQLDAIGTQATQTLASVQASVTGFAEQASALSMQGQQAEQQMRGALSVTAGMQEQARHLREAMQVETARVVEHLSSVIAQLDATNRQLKTESTAATHMLGQTTEQFAAATKSGADMIRSQAELLAQTSEQSDARMTNAGEKMRSHLRLIGEVGDQAQAQAQQLANSAEHATTRLVALRETLTTTDREGSDIIATTSQRIDDVRSALQAELLRLSEMSLQSVTDVNTATQSLAVQSDTLRANLAASESALSEAAALVREESSHLPGTLNRSVAEIESTTHLLKGYAAEADQSLIGTADRFISVTAAARGNMIDEMQRVSNVADDADKVLRHFNQMLAEQVAAMQQSTSMLSSEQKDLVEKAGLSVGALAQASDRLTTLRGEASVTAERLAHDFELLDQRATATSGRLVQASEGVARQMEAINDAATRAEMQLTGANDTFREQLERIRGGLQGQIDDINRGLMQITAQLERTGASLRSTTVGAVADVERIGQRFEQTSGNASEQVAERTRQMQKATEEVAKLLAGFDTQMDGMLSRMASAGEGIRGQQGPVVDQLQSMLGHLGAVAEKLETAREMSGNVSQHAIERLDDVVNAVQAHMNNMTAGAQTAAGIMRGIGQIYGDQTQNLSKGVGEAHTQVQTMNKSIGEMQERTDRMRASLKMQGDELMSSLRQILSQLETTGDGLSEAVDRTLQQQAADELKKMG